MRLIFALSWCDEIFMHCGLVIKLFSGLMFEYTSYYSTPATRKCRGSSRISKDRVPLSLYIWAQVKRGCIIHEFGLDVIYTTTRFVSSFFAKDKNVVHVRDIIESVCITDRVMYYVRDRVLSLYISPVHVYIYRPSASWWIQVLFITLLTKTSKSYVQRKEKTSKGEEGKMITNGSAIVLC